MVASSESAAATAAAQRQLQVRWACSSLVALALSGYSGRRLGRKRHSVLQLSSGAALFAKLDCCTIHAGRHQCFAVVQRHLYSSNQHKCFLLIPVIPLNNSCCF